MTQNHITTYNYVGSTLYVVLVHMYVRCSDVHVLLLEPVSDTLAGCASQSLLAAIVAVVLAIKVTG